MNITLQVSRNGDWEKLTYIGSINEDSELHLPPLLQSLGQNVVVNFKQVDNVNSCGVRAWITFMRDLEKGRKVVFEECTPEIVSQINMIPNFKGNAEVQSLYGSYTCPNCGNQQTHLFVKGKNLPTSSGDGSEAVNCEKCGKKSELDELEEEFFHGSTQVEGSAMNDVLKVNDPALEAFKPFEHFCKAMLDGFVVVNIEGKIMKCNPMVAQMSGMTGKQLLASNSFDEVFKMEVGGSTLTIANILSNAVPKRFDEITCHSWKESNHRDLRIIIGFYPFLQDGKVIGGWLLLRDVTAETQLQDKYKDKATKSITDPMTGLFNRAHFEDFMKTQEKALVQLPVDSDHRNLSVIMGDIDFFKKINDKYGHPTGDYVIKTVAQIVAKSVRKTDVVCRYGGEEFLIILPASNLEGAAVAAEKVRQSIESHAFEFEGNKIPVRMSLGVAQLHVGKEEGKDAIARADAALYGSKQNGRNQVSLHVGGAIAPSAYKPTGSLQDAS